MIHEKGISFPPVLLSKLNDGALKQQEAVFQLYSRNKNTPIPVWRVRNILNLKVQSAGRAVTNLADTDHKKNKHLDRYGQPPLVKMDKKVSNEDGSASVHCWKWNPRYGKVPMDAEPVQADMFGRPQEKSNAYSAKGA
nr:hypothetical protein 1 [Balneolaceae bacterium]